MLFIWFKLPINKHLNLETMANKTSKRLDFSTALAKGNELVLKDNQIGLFILIALNTGMRCGDILKLNKSNFFKEGSRFFVRFKAQKTKKDAVRPISETVYKEVNKAGNDIVFYNFKYGCPYSAMWVNRNLKIIFKAEHIKAKQQGLNISAHSLRKSAGLQVYEGSGLETARDFLQHTSYDVTKAYLNVTTTELNEKLSRVFGF
jgi:integrase